jgi:protein subunit release factor B
VVLPNFPVSSDKWKALEARLLKLGIREQDLDERFVRAGGPGGQNVNKVSTCVILSHGPSGISVRCQEERSQGLNRFLARKRLADKIEEVVLGVASRRQQEIEKIRRQKRKRSKRAKEKMLESKHQRAELKANRKPVDSNE